MIFFNWTSFNLPATGQLNTIKVPFLTQIGLKDVAETIWRKKIKITEYFSVGALIPAILLMILIHEKQRNLDHVREPGPSLFANNKF